jgi:hypothetical protein
VDWLTLPEIGFRLAAELRSPDLVSAGLRQAYYPAPSSLVETPAALVFTNLFTITPLGGEELWEGTTRVQLMIAATTGRLAAEINALEPLVEPILTHFAPGTDAYHLRQAGSPAQADKCYPASVEASQVIEYAGHDYSALTILFDIRFHRAYGG